MVWKLTLIPVFHLLDNLPNLQVQPYFEPLDNLMVLYHQRWSIVEGPQIYLPSGCSKSCRSSIQPGIAEEEEHPFLRTSLRLV